MVESRLVIRRRIESIMVAALRTLLDALLIFYLFRICFGRIIDSGLGLRGDEERIRY